MYKGGGRGFRIPLSRCSGKSAFVWSGSPMLGQLHFWGNAELIFDWIRIFFPFFHKLGRFFFVRDRSTSKMPLTKRQCKGLKQKLKRLKQPTKVGPEHSRFLAFRQLEGWGRPGWPRLGLVRVWRHARRRQRPTGTASVWWVHKYGR